MSWLLGSLIVPNLDVGHELATIGLINQTNLNQSKECISHFKT